MLCSLPAPKSSWLDRLHSLKGFTAPSPSSPAASASPTPPPPPPQIQHPPSHPLTAVLSDLFVIHPPPPSQRPSLSKRHPFRKQPAPKICLLNTTATATTISSSPAAPANAASSAHPKNTKNKNNNNKHNKNSKTLHPASPSHASPPPPSKGRTDATVIDTSTPGWKSAKLLIRKGSVWKIRDKKHCNAGFTKRKRLTHASNKHKHLLNVAHKPSHPLHQGDNHEESIDVTQVPVKRPRLSKLPSIPEAAKSIALHLKVRSNGKKKGLSSNSSLKENVQY